MSILFLLLALLFAACAVTALLSGAFLWYEAAGRQPDLLQERLAPPRRRFAARFLLTETFCLFVSILQRPLAWVPCKRVPDHPAAQPPVLLLHGLFHNRSSWGWTARQLRRRGIRVYAIDLPLWHTPERAVAILAAKIEELTGLGAIAVDLVGHSMGGLIARQYLQEHGADKVRRLILLGAPNGGSRLAPFAVSPLGRMLLPASPYLQRLNATPVPPKVHCTAIYSRHDNLVVPWESGRLEGARNVEVTGVGHTALLYHPTVIDRIIKELTEKSDENP